jgi:hypothetical protein
MKNISKLTKIIAVKGAVANQSFCPTFWHKLLSNFAKAKPKTNQSLRCTEVDSPDRSEATATRTIKNQKNQRVIRTKIFDLRQCLKMISIRQLQKKDYENWKRLWLNIFLFTKLNSQKKLQNQIGRK